MFVKVTRNGAVSLEDRDNFRAFRLVIEDVASRRDHVERQLGSLAQLIDETHAWVSETNLRIRPEVVGDLEWQSKLDAMIENARSHGWINDQTRAIKAHIDWVS